MKYLIHYDEIGLKGKNRLFFERKLITNIEKKLQHYGINAKLRRVWGRIFLEYSQPDDAEMIRKILKKTPGVASFGKAYQSEKTEDFVFTFLDELIPVFSGKSFRVSARRIDKNFPMTSHEIERELGAYVLERAKTARVSLKFFDLELILEVLDDEIIAYVKEKGLGGLPVGASGRAVSLISAGFDSPIASYMLLKRGVQVFPIHFHSLPKTSQRSVDTVRELTELISAYAPRMQLALVPVLKIQKHIAKYAPEKLRILLLRRSMMRMANKYAKRKKALALITGESVGQVASQTLENLLVIGDASELPVLRPLSGSHKNEIIDIARKIGSYELSARDCEDTCSLFLPKKPETRGKLFEVLAVEEKLNLLALEAEALKESEIIKIID